jgi:hypothetical protein
VLECLSMLQVFGGIHHCDVKPENMLFRVRAVRAKAAPPPFDSFEERRVHGLLASLVADGGKKIEFVLSDFGSAVSQPELDELRDVRGTPGYLCPLVHDTYGEFKEEFEQRLFRKYAVLPAGRKFSAPSVWASYGAHRKQRVAGTLDVDKAMMKNDLYALGATMLNFVYPRELSFVADLGAALMLGDERNGIWTISAAQDALDSARARVEADGKADELVDFKRKNRLQPTMPPFEAAPPAPKAVFKAFFSDAANSAAAVSSSNKGNARKNKPSFARLLQG